MWMTSRNYKTLENALTRNTHKFPHNVTCTPLMAFETTTSTECKSYQFSYLVCLLAKQFVEFFINASALPPSHAFIAPPRKEIPSPIHWVLLGLLTWETGSTVMGYCTIYDDFFNALHFHSKTTMIISGILGLLSTLFYMLAYTPYTITTVENTWHHGVFSSKTTVDNRDQQTNVEEKKSQQVFLLS